MLGDDAQIAGERAQPGPTPGGRSCAHSCSRADVGDRLDHGQVVAAAEQREQAPWMVVRPSAARRAPAALPVNCAGTASAVSSATRRGVAVPGRARDELRQVREELGLEAAVGPLERRHRQLVEDDVHDRCRGPAGPGNRADASRGQTGPPRGRTRGTARGRRAGRARARSGTCVRLGGAAYSSAAPAPTSSATATDGRRPARGRPAGQDERGARAARSARAAAPSRSGTRTPGRPHATAPSERGDQRVGQREDDDVRRRARARDEELGAVAEDLEERLDEGQRPERAAPRCIVRARQEADGRGGSLTPADAPRRACASRTRLDAVDARSAPPAPARRSALS